jgi:broad specificity phosphatase PhoE
MNNFCKIYLVRHGQSEANVADLYGLDTPLTQKGQKQIAELSEKLRNIHFDAIFSSTMLRAKQSAQIIALDHKLAVETIHALRERHYGILEGKRGKQIYQQMQNLFNERSVLAYNERIKFKFSDDYESDQEVMGRYITALREIAIAYIDKTVLIVSHVSAMKNLLYHLAYARHNDMEGQAIDNSGYIHLRSDGVDFFIEEVVGVKYPAA